MNGSAPRDRAREVAEQLEGTCQSLQDVASEEEIDNVEFCEALDEMVLLCPCCGWWSPVEDFVESEGEEVCEECAHG